MSWIKIDSMLIHKPKVIRIARDLNLQRETLIGYLVKFWSLADSITEDGHLSAYEAEDVDALVGLKGFGKALAQVGWIVFDAEGAMLPNFDLHNGESAKKRANTSLRVARHKRAKCDGNAESVNKVTQEALPKALRRGEEKREEKKRESLSMMDADASTLSLDSLTSMAPVTIEEALEMGKAEHWAPVAVKKWWHYNDAQNWQDVTNWRSSLKLWMLREKPEKAEKTLNNAQAPAAVFVGNCAVEAE